MADAAFEDPRLAGLYDPLDPDRGDLDVYLAIAQELGARQVLDVGCGTGTFALLLADHGFGVTGVDPAKASLDIARAAPKPLQPDQSERDQPCRPFNVPAQQFHHTPVLEIHLPFFYNEGRRAIMIKEMHR